MERDRRAKPDPAPRYKWPVDESVEYHGWAISGGLPPKGHPRRCQGTTRWGTQCSNWARAYRSTCAWHGRGDRAWRRRKGLGWYGRQAGSQLAKHIEALRKEESDLHGLEEEILAARAVADRSLSLFEQACLQDKADKVPPETQAMACACAREALTHVAVLVEKSAKVRAINQHLIEPADVQLVADTMVLEAKRVLEGAGVSAEIIAQLEQAIAKMPMPVRESTAGVSISIA